MILAAGKGERMRPLTNHRPKPLLSVGDKPLIQYHVENLAAAGFSELVVNVSWLGDQIERFLAARDWGCSITLSREESPLETAGGIIRALPHLGEAPFALVNGDIWTDYPLAGLRRHHDLPADGAYLVLVDNPAHNPEGDFFLRADGRLRRRSPAGAQRLTYAGIAVFDPGFFKGAAPGRQALLPFLERAMPEQRVCGEHYRGQWEDVGTPERLRALDARLGIH
jgi:MurNAc alpha-1-phosphate uridylyltransferase